MIITFAALTALYFGFAFIAFVRDRIVARFPAPVAPVYFPEAEEPSESGIIESILENEEFYRQQFRPAPVIAKAGLYQQCSIRQLKFLAKGRNVKAWSRATKQQLVEALS